VLQQRCSYLNRQGPEQSGSLECLLCIAKVNSRQAKIPNESVKFNVDDLVRITKQKVAFEKAYAQTFSSEIFRVVKVITRVLQPAYELSGLQDSHI
jgi:hypothetical protein